MKIGFALIVALVSSPVVAQETGTLINRGRTAAAQGYTANDARSTMLGYAACVYGRSPGRVKTMLSYPMADARYEQMHRNLFRQYSDCFDGGEAAQINFSDTSLRGALYEALYRREFARSAPTDFTAIGKIDYGAGYPQPIDSRYHTAIALGAYGDCVSRRAPADARKLMLATPGLPAEDQIFSSLAPHLGPCLPNGQKLRFSKSVLRGVVAEGLYRLSAASTETVK